MARGSSTARQQQQPPAPKGLTEAVLFVSRASIRPLLRQELKSAGIAGIFNVETADACLGELAQHPQALLIIDWEHGAEVVSATLRAAKGAFGIDTRPIFIIATEMSLQLVATAAEYYVSRIHSGEVSRGAIQEHLDLLVDQESSEHGLRVLLTRAADARARGDWQTASHILSEMHRRFPGDRRITCELAENLIREERWGEASALVEQLASSSSHDLRVQHLKARCLMKDGRFEEASALLAESRLINPFNVDRLVDLGKALMQIDRVKEALGVFDEALQLDPTSKDAAHGKIQCRLMDGEVNDALTLMRQLTTPRELASLFNNAAILSIRHGRFEQGLSLYHTAIGALGPADGLVSRLFYNLGLAYHKHGRADQALDCFERAVKIDGGFDKARHNAQVVAGRLGADVIDEEQMTPTEAKARPFTR